MRASLSNGYVVSQARRMGWAFRNSLNLRPGSRIAIFSPNHTTYPIAIYACELSGMVATLINPGSTAKELASFLSMTDASVILAHPSILDKAKEAVQECPSVRLLAFSDTDDFEKTESVPDIRSLHCEEELETYKILDPYNETVL